MSALPTPAPTGSEAASPKRHHHMSGNQRILFFLTAWLIILMPFLFWWNTWFGRRLSDKQLMEYLHDDKKPRHIQHAMVQIGERMAHHDSGVVRWYPDLVQLASYRVEEVRNTDAWVMGQDTSGPGFHEALLKMLADPSPTVRGNVALSLVRFGDATGRPELVSLLQPAEVAAPQSGKVIDEAAVGTSVHQNGVIAKLRSGDQTLEVRSPIAGRVTTLFAQKDANIDAGARLAVLTPATDQVWEALRALYLVGRPEDLPAVLPYERAVQEIPDHVRQQAVLTAQAIRERGGR